MTPGDPQSAPRRRPRVRSLTRLLLIAVVIALAVSAAIGVAATSAGPHPLASLHPTATRASATGRQHAAPRSTSPTQRPIPAFTPPVTCVPTESASPLPVCTPCPAGEGLKPSSPISCWPCPPQSEAPSIACPLPTQTPGAKPPAAGSPTIWFCPASPLPYYLAPGEIALKGFLCGSHFQPGERVTLTVSGSRGSFAWQLSADASGNFIASLPPALCQRLPLTIVADGNEGSHSNVLAFVANACLPTA
jgi:hypothetical protein